MGFKSMKKMETTEPSVDEVGKGMKKGGKTKKMAMGGGMPMGALQAAAPAMAAPAMARRRPMAKRPDPRQAMMEAAMAEEAARPMMRRKKGGEVESKSMHAKEERQIKGIKKELMTHEGKPASKAHKGLKTGGITGYATGGRLGSQPTPKDMEMMGKAEAQSMLDKLRFDNARNMKRLGPQPTPKDMEMMKEAMPKRKGGIAKYATGGIIQKFATGGVVNGAAGYKAGGHAVMSCKDGGGFKAMKKGNC